MGHYVVCFDDVIEIEFLDHSRYFSVSPYILIFVLNSWECNCFKSVILHPKSEDNTEKIWEHRFYAKQKTDVPKARKVAAGGLGSAVSPPRVAKPPKSFGFFCLKHGKTAIVEVKIR